MANTNEMPNGDAVDKKAAKQAAKLAKKEEKAASREEKRRKKLEKAGASPEEINQAMENAGYEEEGGSRLAVFFVTLVIIAIWLAILVLLVKMC